jgi:hypothetical protein
MTSSDLATLVRDAVKTYDYPRVQATVGTLWSASRVANELQLLSASLVEPSQRTLHIHKQPDDVAWLVAVERGVAVYFSEVHGQFGLGGLGPDGSITDWGVYGDVVGTFMAR